MPVDPHGIESANPGAAAAGSMTDVVRRLTSLERLIAAPLATPAARGSTAAGGARGTFTDIGYQYPSAATFVVVTAGVGPVVLLAHGVYSQSTGIAQTPAPSFGRYPSGTAPTSTSTGWTQFGQWAPSPSVGNGGSALMRGNATDTTAVPGHVYTYAIWWDSSADHNSSFESLQNWQFTVVAAN